MELTAKQEHLFYITRLVIFMKNDRTRLGKRKAKSPSRVENTV